MIPKAPSISRAGTRSWPGAATEARTAQRRTPPVIPLTDGGKLSCDLPSDRAA